jgi:hypothetical protein
MTSSELPPSSPPPPPDRSAVRKYLVFTLSLPERTLRSTVGLVGGAASEAASLLLPRAFRDSKTYQSLIQANLEYLLKNVGGVQRTADPAKQGGDSASGQPSPAEVENYVARKTVGNFVDAVGLLTFHLSPVVILAVLSDVAHGSNAFLKELGQELKSQGLIAEDSTINHADDLLSAVESASRSTADAVNTPPLSVAGLKETIAQTRAAVAGVHPTKLIPKAELKRMWDEMQAIAKQEGVSLWTVSSAMTMHVLGKIGAVGRGMASGVRVAGSLVQIHILEHYASALRSVRERGLYHMLAESWQPYFDAVWSNFALDKPTVTEEVVTGRLFARIWRTVKGWFGCCRGAARPENGGDGPGQ